MVMIMRARRKLRFIQLSLVEWCARGNENSNNNNNNNTTTTTTNNSKPDIVVEKEEKKCLIGDIVILDDKNIGVKEEEKVQKYD